MKRMTEFGCLSKWLLSVSLAALMLVLVAPVTTQAQDSDADAEAIFNRCSERIHRLVARCNRANVETTRNCVRLINRLLDEARFEEAFAAARECIGVIRDRTNECAAAIHEDCRKCIERLNSMGAHRLARVLHRRCERAVKIVRNTSVRLIRIIKNQLPDDG